MSRYDPLDLAVQRARRGWPVFPVAIADTGGHLAKRPLTDHGHLDASTDEAELIRMFDGARHRLRDGEVLGVGQHPGGHQPPKLVIDTDRRPEVDGADTLHALEAEHGALPEHPMVNTPSGGAHHYLTQPAGIRLGESHSLGDGIDVRASGGWVVAPGTSTPWGSWEIDAVTAELPIPEAPAWLIERIQHTNGHAAGWHRIERDTLDSATRSALDALERLGGHGAHLGSRGEVRVTRPGKLAGSSATVGAIGPGVAKLFSSNWTIPGTALTLPTGAVYEADVLQAIADAVQYGDLQRARRLVVERDDLAALLSPNGSGERAVPASSITLTKASAITMDRPRWVWHKRIPVGGVTLLAGREGLGKTALVCHLAAELSHGRLAGEYENRPADTIYVGFEDDRASVTVPRLTAAGMDLDRFLFVDAQAHRFEVATDTNAFIEELRAHPNPVGLVVIDPLDAHLGSAIDTNRDKAKVQATIGHLAELAQDLRCGVVGIGHLNKAPIQELLQKIIGSVGFITSVRSVLGLGEHPDDPAHRLVVLAKANMTDRLSVPAIRFTIEGVVLDHPGHPLGIETGRVKMLGEQAGVDPDSLLARSTEECSALEEAVEWLRSVLSKGPMARKVVMKYARAEGIAERTLKRAQQRLGVVSERDDTKQGSPASWSLPDTVMSGQERLSGFGPRVMDQESLAYNAQANDVGKHHEWRGFGQTLDVGPKPGPKPDAGSCSPCGGHPDEHPDQPDPL